MRSYVLAGVVALLASSALAQAPPKRLSGTVVALDGDRLQIKLRNGQQAAVLLAPDTRFGALARRSLADIKPGEFVGSAAIPGADGKLHATEVHIFPETMRGAGEGSRPMQEEGDAPGQSMTNASVSEVAAAPVGQELRLKYTGGEKVIEVAPDVRVIELIGGDRGLLVPGAAVMTFVKPAPDGTLRAQFVQAEKDGVKPLF